MIDDLNHLRKACDVAVVKKGALVYVAERAGLSTTLPFDSDWLLFRSRREKGGLGFFGGDQAVRKIGEAIAIIDLVGRLLAEKAKAVGSRSLRAGPTVFVLVFVLVLLLFPPLLFSL